ncbi:MAG: hypothetical protein PUI38_06190 [Candidatus Treponema excrementipullorum]|nr:hypothetical protein [Candidatus Treponema excrementipullorum]
MEEKINIAKILKDKKNGLRLYSPIFGECAFCYVRKDTNDICVKKHNGVIEYFNYEGLYFALGEVMLFPSRKMHDWFKLSWNTGDILVNKDGNAHVIFDGFDDDTYETFNGNNYLWKNEGITMYFGEYEDELPTSDFSKANKEDAQKYIHQIEKRLGYKLNFETLKIEKTHPEFKDGDVLFVKCNDSAFIEIFEYSKKNGDLCDHASLDITNQILDISGKYIIRKDEITELRLATEEEKQQLFLALEKEGKAWDSDKKAIIDLKPKCEFKPFDKVVVRCSESDRWSIDFFGYKVHNGYICTGDAWFGYCLPYNEETVKLIGTTKDMEV